MSVKANEHFQEGYSHFPWPSSAPISSRALQNAVVGVWLDLTIQTNLILNFPGNGRDAHLPCVCLLATERTHSIWLCKHVTKWLSSGRLCLHGVMGDFTHTFPAGGEVGGAWQCKQAEEERTLKGRRAPWQPTWAAIGPLAFFSLQQMNNIPGLKKKRKENRIPAYASFNCYSQSEWWAYRESHAVSHHKVVPWEIWGLIQVCSIAEDWPVTQITFFRKKRDCKGSVLKKKECGEGEREEENLWTGTTQD